MRCVRRLHVILVFVNHVELKSCSHATEYAILWTSRTGNDFLLQGEDVQWLNDTRVAMMTRNQVEMVPKLTFPVMQSIPSNTS